MQPCIVLYKFVVKDLEAVILPPPLSGPIIRGKTIYTTQT